MNSPRRQIAHEPTTACEHTSHRGVDVAGILTGVERPKRREIMSTLARAKRLVAYACEQLMYFLLISFSHSLSPYLSLSLPRCVYLFTSEAGTRSHDPAHGVCTHTHTHARERTWESKNLANKSVRKFVHRRICRLDVTTTTRGLSDRQTGALLCAMIAI